MFTNRLTITAPLNNIFDVQERLENYRRSDLGKYSNAALPFAIIQNHNQLSRAIIHTYYLIGTGGLSQKLRRTFLTTKVCERAKHSSLVLFLWQKEYLIDSAFGR